MFLAFRMLMVLLLLVVVIVLQVYLSRRKAWWPGLVLPVLEVAYSVFAIISAIVGYYAVYGEGVAVTASFIGDLFLAFFQCNILTLVLLAIYFFCRRKGRQKRQLDKMNIQDL